MVKKNKLKFVYLISEGDGQWKWAKSADGQWWTWESQMGEWVKCAPPPGEK